MGRPLAGLEPACYLGGCRVDRANPGIGHVFFMPRTRLRSNHVQQVKIFKSVDTELEDLEKQINRFIRKNNVRVLSISGNHSASMDTGGGPMNTFSGGDVTVIMLFEIESPSR